MGLIVNLGSLIFVWVGGPYIDIYAMQEDGRFQISDQNINVWNYETSKATIPFTDEALHKKVVEWLAEQLND